MITGTLGSEAFTLCPPTHLTQEKFISDNNRFLHKFFLSTDKRVRCLVENTKKENVANPSRIIYWGEKCNGITAPAVLNDVT